MNDKRKNTKQNRAESCLTIDDLRKKYSVNPIEKKEEVERNQRVEELKMKYQKTSEIIKD